MPIAAARSAVAVPTRGSRVSGSLQLDGRGRRGRGGWGQLLPRPAPNGGIGCGRVTDPATRMAPPAGRPFARRSVPGAPELGDVDVEPVHRNPGEVLDLRAEVPADLGEHLAEVQPVLDRDRAV